MTHVEPARRPDTRTLEAIQRRVLWLATLMIHRANADRPGAADIKVGGHQASSASSVGILTYLFFEFLRRGDRVSVKPHASPAFHAVQYLLGNLDAHYLTTLRRFKGLQAYPSRTKDPDGVDFSTGSMGIGAIVPNYAALVERFIRERFGTAEHNRYVALLGDAELDEGTIWETVAEPALAGLNDIIWIVDLNRQSLDRVVPGIRVHQLEQMFRANGWTVLEAKYGARLERAFAETGGGELRRRIDEMPNEEYQLMLRSDTEAIRGSLGRDILRDIPDAELPGLIADLGGHDMSTLRRAFADAEQASGPAVIFAYTVKGWGLPIAGEPLNHQAMLSGEQVERLGSDLGIVPGEEWARFAPDTEEGQLCAARQQALRPQPRARREVPSVPRDLERAYTGSSSTQQTFGLVLTVLGRDVPQVAERIVTASPDVAISTNLGGWINRVGVWSPVEKRDRFAALGPRLIGWNTTPRGQHIELGISESNLLMALGQLGLSAELTGEPLFPIGTLYDPFIARALDAYVYGLYCGARFVLVGTPSGVSLAPEGGAHQSLITPSIGLALPDVVYWEPCFAQECEWILLEAIGTLHAAPKGRSAYLRLSTAPVDQSLLRIEDRGRLREHVLSGAYRIRDRSGEPGYDERRAVQIWTTGIMVPEAIAASDELLRSGIHADVVNCVSPSLVYQRWQAETHGGTRSAVTRNRRSPVVTVIDGHPSALAWVGSMLGVATWPLGVTRFGESGTRQDLYTEFRIDAPAIIETCRAALASER